MNKNFFVQMLRGLKRDEDQGQRLVASRVPCHMIRQREWMVKQPGTPLPS